MNSYKIRTGELEVEVKAADHKAAAIKALQTYSGGPYGLLMEVELVGGDPDKDGWYMSTERVMQDAGISYKRLDGVPNMVQQDMVRQ